MNDKARNEFINWWANEAPMTFDYDDVWIAAKEKYEPKPMPIEEGCLRMVLSLVDGGAVKQVAKLIPLIQIETSNCNEVERYAAQCWRELNAPITQGEEK